jgi:hypothetical protein
VEDPASPQQPDAPPPRTLCALGARPHPKPPPTPAEPNPTPARPDSPPTRTRRPGRCLDTPAPGAPAPGQ